MKEKCYGIINRIKACSISSVRRPDTVSLHFIHLPDQPPGNGCAAMKRRSKMEENKQNKPGLFRERSLEAIESPEKLNDYLRVTSPGVWLILGACIVLLLGFVLWSIFGSIDTTVKLAVSSSNGRTVCYVPYNELEQVSQRGEVTLNGKTYPFRTATEAKVIVVSEEMDPYVRVGGGLAIGDVTVELELDTDLPDGVYSASVVTERLQPISLLLK